jgi:hypothetical protein
MRCQQRLGSGESQRHATIISWTIALALGTAGCTFVLDNQKNQCETNADCAHFKGHPLCDDGVCVVSGLMPDDCIVLNGPPKNQNEFLNACSTSKCVPFKNCDHLKLCEADKPLPAAQDQHTKKATAPVIQALAPAPDELCTKNAPAGGLIYLYGSADFGPLLRASQPSLSALPTPYRAVFQGSTSCNGVTAAFDPNHTNTLMKDPTCSPQPCVPTGWAFYFDDSGKQVNCRLDDPTTTAVEVPPQIDIGISNLYSQTCSPDLSPSPQTGGVSEVTGPVVPFVLSVPSTSPENSISAEAAHMVFGLGGNAPAGSGMNPASPWTDWNTYYIRNSGAGSTVLTSLLIDVPRNQFWGVDTLSTENLRDSLLAATANSVTSIGILSVDFNDTNRGNLKALYLQAKGQNCGYQPDSSPTTIDKVNVRDGHYPLWGYVHFFVPDTNKDRAKPMVLLFNAQRYEQRLVDDIIKASLTPQCAMKVARNAEMGDFQVRTGFQCGCYFDFKTKGKTSCQTCVTSEDCPSGAPSCNYGYCEAN